MSTLRPPPGTRVRAIRTITAKDLRQRLRDKSFFLLGILTPLVLAFVLNLVFGGSGEGEIEVRVGVVDDDASDISRGLVEAMDEMDGESGIVVTSIEAGTTPERAIDDHDLDAVLAIPAGFADSIESGGPSSRNSARGPEPPPSLHVVENPDRPIQASVVSSIADGLTADLERTRLLNAASHQLGVPPPSDSSTREDVVLDREYPAGEGLNPAARMLAGMAIMFVFFTVSFGVTNLLEERKAGTLTRLLAAPIRRESILISKAAVAYTLGVIATLVLMVAATFLMDAEWGPWLGVVLLVLAAVLTAVGLMAIVAGVAKTAEGAGGAQSIIAVALAMLGGSWFPIGDGGIMGVLSKLTPHRWFLDGLEELAGADTWTVAGPNILMLCVIAVIFCVPAAILLQRKVAP